MENLKYLLRLNADLPYIEEEYNNEMVLPIKKSDILELVIVYPELVRSVFISQKDKIYFVLSKATVLEDFIIIDEEHKMLVQDIISDFIYTVFEIIMTDLASNIKLITKIKLIALIDNVDTAYREPYIYTGEHEKKNVNTLYFNKHKKALKNIEEITRINSYIGDVLARNYQLA